MREGLYELARRTIKHEETTLNTPNLSLRGLDKNPYCVMWFR